LGTKLVPKAHVGTKFCNYSLVLQDHLSINVAKLNVMEIKV
jgi:hypothetical protein